jgi:hypothetical protein
MTTPGLRPWFVAALVLSLGAGMVRAQDVTLEPLAAPVPADSVSADIASQLAGDGFRLKLGTRILAEVWLAKQWPVAAGFQPTPAIQYPFAPGQLIGVIRYARKGGDFRGQEIAAGTYTLRYALQPVDGNHVGTSDTRDFLLLLPAADDVKPAPVGPEDLIKFSQAAAQTAHPAMLAMKAPAPGDAPAVEHEETHDWWLVKLAGTSVPAGAEAKSLTIEWVVVGKAAE